MRRCSPIEPDSTTPPPVAGTAPEQDGPFHLGRSIAGSVENFGLLGVSKLFVQALHLAALAVITRQLGAELYGRMSVFLMVTQLGYLLTCSWTAVGYTRFATVRNAEGRSVSEVFWSRLSVIAVLVALAGGGGWIGRFPLLDYLGLPTAVLVVALFHLLSLISTDLLRQLAQVGTEFRKLALAQVVEKLLVLVLILVWGGQLLRILWIIIGVTLCVRCATALWFKRSLLLPVRVSGRLCAKLAGFSWPFLFTAVGGFVFGWVDIAVIKQVASLEDVGVYALAYSGMGTVESLALLMPAVLTPIFVTLAHGGQDAKVSRFTQRVIPQIHFLWGLVILAGGLGGYWLIPAVFGGEFAASARIFPVLLMSVYLAVLNSLCGPVFVAYTLVRRMVAINLAASGVNLLLDLLLIPEVGILGAGLATLGAHAFISTMYCLVIGRRFGLAWGRLLLSLGIIGLQVGGLMRWGGTVAGVVATVSAGAVLLLTGWAVGFFRPEDEGLYSVLKMPAPVRRLFVWLCRHGRVGGRTGADEVG
jgi:O-antigen/teichoic acid export membrane protein